MTDFQTFRVVTLNILHDPPQLTWPKRAPLVEAGLVALHPDIVLLQEVAWPDEQATGLAATLQASTGRTYEAHIAGLFATTGWQEGLAVLSKYPCFDISELVFPGAETFCQRVRLDVDGTVIDVYNIIPIPIAQNAVSSRLRWLWHGWVRATTRTQSFSEGISTEHRTVT